MAEKQIDNIKTLVTERAEAPVDKSVLHSPSGLANVEIVTLSVWAQIGVRCLRTFVQSLLGFIVAVGSGAAGGVGINIPAQDFITLIISSASLSVAPAVICLLQNAVEMLSRLDVTNPAIRA